MKVPDATCSDILVWKYALQDLLDQLGKMTPREIGSQLDILYTSAVSAPQISKLDAQRDLVKYLAKSLGVDVEITYPNDMYPQIYVWLLLESISSKVRLIVTIPRSVADLIRHEGRVRDTHKLKLDLTGAKAAAFKALCISQGKPPEDVWQENMQGMLQGFDRRKLKRHKLELTNAGIYLDELLEWLVENDYLVE